MSIFLAVLLVVVAYLFAEMFSSYIESKLR